MTHYDTLGIDPSATAAEIDDAYRSLAKVVHPDRGGDPYVFAALTEAYDVLDDPVQRAAYDAALEVERTSERASARESRDERGRSDEVMASPSVDPASLSMFDRVALSTYEPGESAGTGCLKYFLVSRVALGVVNIAVFFLLLPFAFLRGVGWGLVLLAVALPVIVAWGASTTRKKAGPQS